METTANGWTVLDRTAGVLSFEYSFAKAGKANTFVARLEGGKLLVVSPARGISDAALDDLKEFGEVSFVIAPNGFHHLGVAEWRAKFPDARFFAAPETLKRVLKKNPAAGTMEPLGEVVKLTGSKVGVGEVPNTKCGETWVWVEVEGGYVWFVSDILANMPSLPASFPIKMLFKLTRSAPGFKVFNLALNFIVKDKKATLRAMGEEMRRRPPSMVVPAHGAPLADSDIAEQTAQLIGDAVR